MTEASVINMGISIGGALIAIGGSWGFIRAGIKENTRRITELELSRGKLYTEIGKVGRAVAKIDGKINVMLQKGT